MLAREHSTRTASLSIAGTVIKPKQFLELEHSSTINFCRQVRAVLSRVMADRPLPCRFSISLMSKYPLW
jgi:hypothetical protein